MKASLKTFGRGKDMNELDEWKARYPGKFASEEEIFGHIHRGGAIFIGSACAEPQNLVKALIRFVQAKPKAFFGTEVLHIRSLGVFPFADEKFQRNFRHNTFFIGDNTRDAVNKGLADYTPIFLSRVPDLIYRGLVRIDIALIQTSSIDEHGYMSLGISVDIVKAAAEKASRRCGPGQHVHAPRARRHLYSHQRCGLYRALR